MGSISTSKTTWTQPFDHLLMHMPHSVDFQHIYIEDYMDSAIRPLAHAYATCRRSAAHCPGGVGTRDAHEQSHAELEKRRGGKSSRRRLIDVQSLVDDMPVSFSRRRGTLSIDRIMDNFEAIRSQRPSRTIYNTRLHLAIAMRMASRRIL